eukprot:12900119-Prorocentrum_lima.AAC.1
MLNQRRLSSIGARRRLHLLAVDASPQASQGVEVQVSTEVLLPVCNRDSGPPVKHLCPIVTLGVGRCCLASKVDARVHQMWCEYG